MIRIGLLISVILLASCTYQGDGNYQKDSDWLIFMPATYHKVEFDSFDMSEERVEYKVKNFCSSNSGFQLQLYLNSERPRHWPNEKAELEASLINKKGNSVYQASFSAREGNYVGVGSVGNTIKSYIEIKMAGKLMIFL